MEKYNVSNRSHKPASNKGLVPSAVEVNKGSGHYLRNDDDDNGDNGSKQ